MTSTVSSTDLELASALERVARPVVALTGAGISAESGIPTFRGPEGYWTAGSRHYRPSDIATAAAFARDPRLVWSWYLYRLGVCRAAEPNAAHRAIAAAEEPLGDRLVCVTQNVDGLHRRAGSSRLYEIHGDLELMRCSEGCSNRRWPLPDGLPSPYQGELVGREVLDRLRCPDCGALARPHVLWFDEYYDDELFFFTRSLAAARSCELLLVVGSSGATNLPLQMAATAARAGAILVEVNPEPSGFQPFCDAAAEAYRVPEPASEAVPHLLELLT